MINHVEPSSPSFHTPAPPVVTAPTSTLENNEVNPNNEENNAEKNDSDSMLHSSKEHKEKDDHREKIKAEKKAAKKLIKEITICKIILEEMEVNQYQQILHIDKQFTYIDYFHTHRCTRILGHSYSR